jgi:hypothetical protein
VKTSYQCRKRREGKEEEDEERQITTTAITRKWQDKTLSIKQEEKWNEFKSLYDMIRNKLG